MSKPISISSHQQLLALLHQHHVPLHQWGEGAAKTTHDLWQEIQAGETSLHRSPLLRHVRVVQIIIQRPDGRVLTETVQHLRDGRIRHRHQPPAEKVHGDEDIPTAAHRGLIEELQVSGDRITVYADTHCTAVEYGTSDSYPGLASAYHIHYICADVGGLPSTTFHTAEQDAPHAAVQTHQWEWAAPPSGWLAAQAKITE